MSDQNRLHKRVDLQLSAEINRPDGVFTAATKNLSAGGAALESERPLADGENLRLSLFLVHEGIEDPDAPPLIVGATVRWTAEGDDGTYVAGVQFEHISAEQKQWLENFLAATE